MIYIHFFKKENKLVKDQTNKTKIFGGFQDPTILEKLSSCGN